VGFRVETAGVSTLRFDTAGRLSYIYAYSQYQVRTQKFSLGGGGADPGTIKFIFDFKNYAIEIVL
jgi:hypothetical protein